MVITVIFWNDWIQYLIPLYRHNSFIWSKKLWTPYGIVVEDDLKIEWFKLKIYFADGEEQTLKTRLRALKKIKE
jgi:hypothetical protein